MSIGQVPGAWTHAIVTPVHKGGNASELSSYRPISLTAVTCKIMERVSDLLDYEQIMLLTATNTASYPASLQAPTC